MISRLTAPRFYFCAGRIEKAASLTSRPGGGLSCTLGLSHVEDVYIIFHRPSSSTCTRCHRVTSAAGVRLGGPPIVHARFAVYGNRTTAYRESQTHRGPRERRHTKLRQHARAYQSTLTSFCPPSPPRRRPSRARHDVPARPHVVRSVRPQLDVCSRVKEKTRGW